MKKSFVNAAILILLSTGLLACDQARSPAPTGKVFKIAFVGEETNIWSDEKRDVLKGILAANADAPLLENGDRLEIVNSGPAFPGQSILGQIKQDIEREKISSILLAASSKAVINNKDELDALKIPIIAVTATNPGARSENGYISQISFDDNRQGQAAALYMRDELLIDHVAVLVDEENPYSSFLSQVFRATFERTGGQVNQLTLMTGVESSMLQNWRDQHVEMIYMPLAARKVLPILERLRKINWAPKIMVTDGFLAEVRQSFPERVREVEGLYATDLYSNPSEFVRLARFVKKTAGLYKQMFGAEASTKTALGVESYQLVKSALNRCPDRLNGACINQAIRSSRQQKGMISTYSILADGSAIRPIYINIIEKGRLEMVVKVN